MRAFTPKGYGRPILTSDNPNLKQWRQLVADAAQGAMPTEFEVFAGAVSLFCVFVVPRPKSLPKKVLHCIKKPDLDKLARAVKDALKKVVWNDDSQVVELHARKQYADATTPVGVRVVVEDVNLANCVRVRP